MQSTLLSPSESHAFQSFLSSIDYPDADSVTISPAEWALYNNNATMYSAQDNHLLDSEPNPHHREALTKATKDLMSLDSDSWGAGASMMDHHQGVHQQHQAFSANGHIHSQYDPHQEQRMLIHQQQVMQHQEQHRQQLQQQQRHNSYSTTHEIFPFLHNKVHQPQPHPLQLQYPPQSMQQQHLAVSPMSSDHSSPISPHSPYNFQHQHNSIPMPMHHPPQQQQVQIPPQQTPAPASRAKRMPSAVATSSRSTLQASTSSPNPNATASSSSSHPTLNGTRQSTNGVNGASKRLRSSASPTTNSQSQSQSQQEGQPTAPPKQALLSPSQKKANHIQSEQKRRANIRRGYEALCETVPALREAIREEDEAERNAGLMNGGNRKKSRGKKNGKEGGDEREKDRLDGRAGPRSENVVLSKTIDHIQALLADRESLAARLYRARSSLPPGHPALTPLMPDPPWEREWKGGEGKLGDEDLDGEGVSDGEDGEDE
ncbi:hypothetical protein GALMADRAFT_139765 [Galerina marginata CBS 339.88]|uniref:BHLH domain-containing protein n=1 Tax=Galerina marginata (strain CBS 339.88) TaxID=685588 RepID=A0A067TAL3_GALM3|nr:hypothetical protein GALMADRAFT_139765 [Galerina marginata CBS 339.88]